MLARSLCGQLVRRSALLNACSLVRSLDEMLALSQLLDRHFEVPLTVVDQINRPAIGLSRSAVLCRWRRSLNAATSDTVDDARELQRSTGAPCARAVRRRELTWGR